VEAHVTTKDGYDNHAAIALRHDARKAEAVINKKRERRRGKHQEKAKAAQGSVRRSRSTPREERSINETLSMAFRLGYSKAHRHRA
jgi:lipoate-protein ligase A